MKDFTPTKSKPGFGIIAPTKYLERYSSQSRFHLVLAHLVDTNDEYAEFYAKMSARGDFLICDNGAFELGESYAPDKLIELGHKCKADAIVLPDYPFQSGITTIEASNPLIPLVHQSGFKTMFVPQSQIGDVDDYIETYKWAAENDDIDIIGMSILGMPNAIPHVHIAYARVVMTQILIERGVFNFDKYHHYLGLNSGPALEIPTLINMGVLDSCDSSAPVWAGVCNHRYTRNADSYQSVRKIKKHVDFSHPWTTDSATLDDIQHNINLTLELFDKDIYTDVR